MSMRFIIGRSKFRVFRREFCDAEAGFLTMSRYHDENTKEEDLIHPEDIEHFRKHDELEAEAERILALSSRSIVAENIPDMFRVRR